MLGIKSSLKTKVRFSFSKEAAKSNWRSPRPHWRAGTPGQDSSFGLWLLIYWLMEGQSDPHFLTVPYEAGMNPLTLPSFGRKKSWADVLKPSCLQAVPCTCWQKPLGHQRVLWHQLIPQRPLSPKTPRSRATVLRVRQTQPTDTRLEMIQKMGTMCFYSLPVVTDGSPAFLEGRK